MKRIKLIALDLDGTLLDSKGRLSDVDKASLEKAISQGVQVVIASGRPFGSIPEEIFAISGIEYVITSNGSAVYHVPAQKRMHGYLLNVESVQRILNITGSMDVVYEAFINGVAYADEKYVEDPMMYGASERAVSYIQRTRNPIRDMISFVKEHSDKLDSIDIVAKDVQLKQHVQELLVDVEDVYVTSSVKQLVEISHKDAGKHSGMRYIGELLGIPREEMAAIGNDDNDIDMIEYAGYGIAVANASQACLKAANIVVGSCDANGVTEAIDMLNKIVE